MDKSSKKSASTARTQALMDLCAGVLPVWARQLATSRAQSETAVSEMLQAFSDIGPHIDMAERQSHQITDALSQADGGITGLAQACENVLTPLLNHPQFPAEGRPAIEQVLSMVRDAVTALENISQPFAHETKMVAAQVERMYMGFQYQDRISQMMALLESDIARLQETVQTPGAEVPDLAAWMARLESQYAMAEQRENHSAAAADPGAESKETTFF